VKAPPQPTQPKTQPKQQGSASPDNVAGIALQVKSGSEALEIREASVGDTKYQMECPAKGKPIVMTLTNKSDKKLGVVLKVAGKNTIMQQGDESILCRKWVIPAGKTFEIKGFYTTEKNHLPFTALDGEAAKKAIEQLGDKAQFIQVDVFDDVEGSKPEMTITRGLPQVKDRSARKTYNQLREELLKQSRLKRTRSRDGESVIAPASDDELKENPELKVVDFAPNPLQLGSLTVRITPREAKPQQGGQPKDQPKGGQPKEQGKDQGKAQGEQP